MAIAMQLASGGTVNHTEVLPIIALLMTLCHVHFAVHELHQNPFKHRFVDFGVVFSERSKIL